MRAASLPKTKGETSQGFGSAHPRAELSFGTVGSFGTTAFFCVLMPRVSVVGSWVGPARCATVHLRPGWLVVVRDAFPALTIVAAVLRLARFDPVGRAMTFRLHDGRDVRVVWRTPAAFMRAVRTYDAWACRSHVQVPFGTMTTRQQIWHTCSVAQPARWQPHAWILYFVDVRIFLSSPSHTCLNECTTGKQHPLSRRWQFFFQTAWWHLARDFITK